MARVLLVVPSATYRASAFLDAARRLGLEVVTASEVEAPLEVAGDRFLRLPLDDPEEAAGAIVSFADTSPIDAVVAVDDQGALAAALASEALGLRHARPAAVRATRDKVALHRLLGRAEVPQARFATVEVDLDAWAELPPEARRASALPGPVRRALSSAADRFGYPVVVKPATLSGSRGVIRADDPIAASAAAERVAALLRRLGEPERVLVEAYVPGDEVAFEGILRHGDLDTLAVFDKPDPLVGPYFEETIYVTPSRHPREVQGEVAALVAAAAAALGLREGPVHAEARLPPDGTPPVLLELACRTIGGRCAAALRFSAGASLEDLVLAHALGRPAPAALSEGASGVMMLPIPATGRLAGVEGTDRAAGVTGVTGVEITAPAGSWIEALPEGDRYLGFVFARRPTPGEVEAALRAAHGKLEIRIENPARDDELVNR